MIIVDRPYILKHPLYPKKELIEYFKDHGIEYEPALNAKDNEYQEWWDNTRADIAKGGAPDRPIYHNVTLIKRHKDHQGKEFVTYKETIWSMDRHRINKYFRHEEGITEYPKIIEEFDESKNDNVTHVTGITNSVFTYPYTRETIEELYKLAPSDGSPQGLYIIINGRPHYSNSWFTKPAFASLTFEELEEIAILKVPSEKMKQKILSLGKVPIETRKAANNAK